MDSERFLGRNREWAVTSSCLPLFVCKLFVGIGRVTIKTDT